MELENPHVGQRVILTSLLCVGDFSGEIVSVEQTARKLCVVKLDDQEKPVNGVLYFKKRPRVVCSNAWQICYPELERN